MMNTAQVENWFRYHSPDEQQLTQYEAIRSSAKQLALVILAATPESADQSAAMRKLRECVMTANAAIACRGK